MPLQEKIEGQKGSRNGQLVRNIHENEEELSSCQDSTLIEGFDVCRCRIFVDFFVFGFGCVVGVVCADDGEGFCFGKTGCCFACEGSWDPAVAGRWNC